MKQRILQLLFWGWVGVTLATVATFATGRLELAVPLSGLVVGWAAALVVVPALLLLAHTLRHPPTDIGRETRRSAIESGVALLGAAGLLFVTVRAIELGGMFLVPIIAVAVLGVALVGRALTLDPLGIAAHGPPILRHRPATIAGIATLASFAILAPKVGGAAPERGTPTEENMRLDLRTLVTRQDEYFMTHNRYAALVELGDAFQPTNSGAEIAVTAERSRFIARATHRRTRLTCLVWTGSPPPPADSVHGAEDGVPACWEG